MRPEDYDARTDEELVASFQASGSEGAFAGNPADAEDLTAQAFTLAWREARQFQGGDSFHS